MFLVRLALTGDSTEGVDATQCPSGVGVCTACADASEGGRPYWNGSECVSCGDGHPKGYYYFNFATKQCVPYCSRNSLTIANNVCISCPEEAPLFEETLQKCVTCDEKYHGQYPYWDPMTGYCTHKCPDARPTKKNSNICKICSELDPTRPYWDKITLRCSDYDNPNHDRNPITPYWNETSHEFQTCAETFGEDREIWNPNTLECVSECPVDTPVYYQYFTTEKPKAYCL